MNVTTTINKSDIKEKEFISLKNLVIEDFDMLQDLLRFESVSKKESKVALYIKQKLIELGFNIEKDDIGNVFATRGIADKYALLNAHMDIVNLTRGFSSSSYYKNEKKSSDEDKYNKYNNLNLNSYNYDLELSKEIIDIKAKKLSTQNKTAIDINDLSDEEAMEVWEEDSKEIKKMYGEDFKMVGFKCANCVNSCKAYKLCYYFEPNSNIETKKVYLKSKKELELSKTQCFKEDDKNFIQESFDLDNKMIPLRKIEKGNSGSINKDKNKKYIIKVDLIGDKISGSGKERVLGGDDKCGIFIALKIAEILRDTPMKILFTTQEEIGCNGVKHFVKHNPKWLEDVKYSITIDRRDYCHLLWSQRGVRSCSDNFAAEIMYHGIRSGIPVKLEDGGSADVVTLRNYVPEAINISAGYYKAHTVNEYIVPSEVDKIVGWVKNIINYI